MRGVGTGCHRLSAPAAVCREALNRRPDSVSMTHPACRYTRPPPAVPRSSDLYMNSIHRLSRPRPCWRSCLRRCRSGSRASTWRHARHVSRGHHAIHARERSDRPALSGRERGQDDRQPHLSRRLATRELRRDGNGASARAHDVQGHVDFRRPEVGVGQARNALQRLDLVRPHQLSRDVQRIARRSRNGCSRWKRTG